MIFTSEELDESEIVPFCVLPLSVALAVGGSVLLGDSDVLIIVLVVVVATVDVEKLYPSDESVSCMAD
jgi:hypothetical protein